MPQHFYLFIIFLASTSITNAQINDRIKENSDKNSENRDRDRGNHSDSDDIDFEGDDCSACMDGCFLTFDVFDLIYTGLDNLNYNIKAKEPEISRINSVNLSLPFGHVTQNSNSFCPRIEINGSLLSTGLRVFTNTENHIEGKNSYTTVDWQTLMFNFVVEPEVNFRIGSGIMYENYSETFFNEHTASLDIYIKDRIKWNMEGRYTPDYETKITVRAEFNTSIHYLLFQKNNTLISGFVKYLTANYYEDVKFNAFYAGVEFNFGY